ncbi:MAG TPA: outer membrane beta-barrel protein [Cyclobacteriaceae bacterium]|nr:outer membrane beta-barrel protein [Cyclobacteriaceae bacterium]
MKKALFTLLLAGFICFTASAQTQTRVGGLLGFGTDSDYGNVGIGGIAEFLLNEKMAISPSLVFFFPKDESGVKFSLWELNANFNYYFLDESSVSLYGLAGLIFQGAKVKYEYLGDSYSDSDTNVGLNLGIGSNFHVSNDKILPFAELKYVITDADQLEIFAGVKFNLK